MDDSPAPRHVGRGYRGDPTPAKLGEIVRYFLFIGTVGFGGPLVHIAMMEDDLVGRDGREWTSESVFLEGLAICNVLPGPASTQLGIFMGWVYAGNVGAIAAGVAFVAPTFVIVVALSYLYFAYRTVPAMGAFFFGINPVVIGLIVGASYSMARSALGQGETDVGFEIDGDEWRVDLTLVALLLGALAATAILNPNPVLEFVAAGLLAVVVYRSDWVRAHAGRLTVWALAASVLGLLYLFRERIAGALGPSVRRTVGRGPIGGVLLALWANVWVKLFLFMLYTGSFIYGGGLVLIPFIEKYVVNEFGWMSAATFVDGIAIGQLSPGPVVMTAAFIGYELMFDVYGNVPMAVLGAFVATIGAFGPSFLFITVFFPYFAAVREQAVVRSALVGVNAAVVGAILGATVTLAGEAFVEPLPVGLALVTFVLFVRGIHAAYLIAGGGGIGVLASALL